MQHLAIVALLALGLTALGKIFYNIFSFHWKSRSKSRSRTVGIVLSFFAVSTTLLFLELVFHLFVIHTDFFGFTYAASRWWDIYWKPINHHEYRDVEHSHDLSGKKRILFVVGDSIVAGQGINDVQDRFSDILQRKLGTTWEVYNIAKCGWSTVHELHGLETALLEAQPEVIILTYYSNDFEGAIAHVEGKTPKAVSPPTGYLGDLINNSALLNFIYWRFYRIFNPDLGETYWTLLRDQWNNPRVQSEHLVEIDRFRELAVKNSHLFVTMIVPTLLSPTQDRFITDVVRARLEAAQSPVIDLHESLKDWPARKLVVSTTDHHPSVAVNKMMADVLYSEIEHRLEEK